jgi:UDP-glucuronate 4-epimerase
MRYAVTGAAGFIGSHLAEELLRRGHNVVGMDSFTDYYDVALKEDNARAIEVVRLDLGRDELDFGGFDGVFHLAGQPGVAPSFDAFPLYVQRNLLASQRVFEAAARAGKRVVFASSSSVYGAVEQYPTPEDARPAPLSPYGLTKLAAEHLALALGRSVDLDVVVLRYFSVFGPRQRPDMAFAQIARALAEDRSFTLHGDGAQTRAWTYVGDVVEATIAAMERGAGTYNVGGGSEISLREAVAAFEALAGRPLAVEERPVAPGEPQRTSADTSKIAAELGWQPRTPLLEGLRAQWEWVLESGTRGSVGRGKEEKWQ